MAEPDQIAQPMNDGIGTLVSPQGLGQDLDIVRDPVYGYIPFSKELEKPLIDTDFVQRLRRIRQTQTAYLVYPGADHCRFQHSLGVMHLAGLITASALTDYLRTGCRLPLHASLLVQIARFAGLLHDIGHGPWGHSFEDTVLREFNKRHPKFGVLNHDDVGLKMIRDSSLTSLLAELEKSLPAKIQEQIRRLEERHLPSTLADLVCQFIHPEHLIFKEMPAFGALSRALEGQISVDILDYVLRDSHFCGTLEYGKSDYLRLTATAMLGDLRDGVLLLAPSYRSRETHKTFLFQRYQMFNNVYFHRTVKIATKMIENLLELAYDVLGLDEILQQVFSSPPDWEPYLSLDDHSLLSLIDIVDNQRTGDEGRRKTRRVLAGSSKGRGLTEQHPLGDLLKRIFTARDTNHAKDRKTLQRKTTRAHELLRKLVNRELEWELLLEAQSTRDNPGLLEITVTDTPTFTIEVTEPIDQSFHRPKEQFTTAICEILTDLGYNPDSHFKQNSEYDNTFLFDATSIWGVPNDPAAHFYELFYVANDHRVQVESVDQAPTKYKKSRPITTYPPMARLTLRLFMRRGFRTKLGEEGFEKLKAGLLQAADGLSKPRFTVRM